MFTIVLFITFVITWAAFATVLGSRMSAQKIPESGILFFLGFITIAWLVAASNILFALDIYESGPYFFGMLILLFVTIVGLKNILLWTNKKNERYRQINDEAKLKVEALLKQYTPYLPKEGQAGIPLPMSIDLVNKEVTVAVKKYKDDIAARQDKYISVSDELKTILACKGCPTENVKCRYLNKNIEKIKALKNECDRLLGGKIMLLGEDSDLMFELKLAFQYLQNSKKCVSSGVNVTEFVSSVKPQELSMFQYDNEPVTLHLGQHYFCLFSQVILVFDEAGIFVNAIDPSAMRIDVIKAEDELMMLNEDPISNQASNQYIDEDSICIKVGEVQETWLHTCRDGSPDLRYRDNPRYLYMTNRYQYTIIRFGIADEMIRFEASSIAVYEAFSVLAPKYIRKCNNKHDPIPRLMQLMKMIGDNEDMCLQSIVESYAGRADKHSCYCKLIEA